MSLTLPFIVAGCLLGILQLGAGVALGMWLRRPGDRLPDTKSRDADLRRARAVALELHGLTQRVGGQVAAHRARFEAADARLREVPAGKHHPTTDLVVGVVGEILAANRQLQAELATAEKQIAAQATEIVSHVTTSLTDPLTNLPNRRALNEQLARRQEDYRKHGTPFSLLMLDVDHFKQVNDTFGHPAGDEVLVGMGNALRGALRKHDFVARFGGEEFAVIFTHTSLDEAQRAAAKACAGLSDLAGEFEYLDRPVTASGGLASIHPSEEVESLIRRADDAMYMAKQNGRNRIYLHDGTLCKPLVEELASGAAWQPTPESPEAETAGHERTAPPADEHSALVLEACDELRNAMSAVATRD